MKILVFTYSISRLAGGLFSAVQDLFTNINFEGTKLKLYTFKDKYSDQDVSSWKGLSIHFFKPYWFLYSRKAKKKLLCEDVDILHMEGLWRYPQLFMYTWKIKRNKPIVCSPHGMLDPYIIIMQGKMKRMIAKIFFQKSLNAVTCYHALCKKELEDIRKYGLLQPVAIIPNGVNIPEPAKIEALKSKKRDDKKHLLYLGRLHKKKGIDLLIEAFARINRDAPDMLKKWVLDIVGWDDDGFFSQLKKMVNKYGLENVVIFHGGLFGDEKDKIYNLSDAYILPSHGEGLPMTILEAWSWKLPVLMTPKCNIPEGFEANAAIFMVDNIVSIENGLKRLFAMTDIERKEMGERGYNLLKERFTWNISAQKMLALYEWLLGKREKPEFVYED